MSIKISNTNDFVFFQEAVEQDSNGKKPEISMACKKNHTTCGVYNPFKSDSSDEDDLLNEILSSGSLKR